MHVAHLATEGEEEKPLTRAQIDEELPWLCTEARMQSAPEPC